MNGGLMTCLCVGALIWAGIALIGSITGRNRRAHLVGGTSADPWASAGLAWLFWSHHHHDDAPAHVADNGDQSALYIDGDVATPDADGEQGWDGGGSDSGGWSTD